MTELSTKFPPFLFLVAFIVMWLMATTSLGAMSGWFTLARAFPDQPEEPTLKLRWQSGSMGIGVGMNNCMSFSVCSSGLRIGLMRIFMPFSHDFMVPWSQISVTHKAQFLRNVAVLSFGNLEIGKLKISASAANELKDAAKNKWPKNLGSVELPDERGPISALKQWAIGAAFAASFFTIVPRIVGSQNDLPSLSVTILFPAIAMAIIVAIQYAFRRGR